jgi:AraC-like DNA-binding protein
MEMLITIVIWAAILQGLLLGIIFITSKKHRSFANQLLGSFLLSFVFAALTDLLPFREIWGYSIEGYFTLPEVKLLFPVLFLHFILEKVGKSSTYAMFLKIHYFLAFGIICITLINIMLFMFSGSSLLEYVGWPLLDRFFMGQQYYAFVLTVIIFIIAINETLRYRNLIRNEFSDMDLLDINWLWQCIFAIGPIILFWGVELVRIIIGGIGQSDLTIAAYIFIAVFIYFVSFKAFTQQTLFDGSFDNLKALDPDSIISNKASTTVEVELCGVIKSKMQTNEYYLNQDLTLHLFAKEILVSARTISTCVNQNLGLNFNEWVNNYRVDKALGIIKTDTKNQLTIEGIGFDAGFKSRSAMYSAFKKKLGQSPGHFR